MHTILSPKLINELGYHLNVCALLNLLGLNLKSQGRRCYWDVMVNFNVLA